MLMNTVPTTTTVEPKRNEQMPTYLLWWVIQGTELRSWSKPDHLCHFLQMSQLWGQTIFPTKEFLFLFMFLFWESIISPVEAAEIYFLLVLLPKYFDSEPKVVMKLNDDFKGDLCFQNSHFLNYSPIHTQVVLGNRMFPRKALLHCIFESIPPILWQCFMVQCRCTLKNYLVTVFLKNQVISKTLYPL